MSLTLIRNINGPKIKHVEHRTAPQRAGSLSLLREFVYKAMTETIKYTCLNNLQPNVSLIGFCSLLRPKIFVDQL